MAILQSMMLGAKGPSRKQFEGKRRYLMPASETPTTSQRPEGIAVG